MTKVASVLMSKARDKRQVNTNNGNTFPFTLFEILESRRYDCLQWSVDGTRVVVTNKRAVIQRVLPGNFETSKFESFTRQFHIYDFKRTTDNRKIKNTQGYCEFEHSYFRRGRRDMLDRVQRKKAVKDLSNSRSPTDTSDVVQRIRASNLTSSSTGPRPMQLDVVTTSPSATTPQSALLSDGLDAFGQSSMMHAAQLSGSFADADSIPSNTNLLQQARERSLDVDTVTKVIFEHLRQLADISDQAPLETQVFLVDMYGKLQESARCCRDALLELQQLKVADAASSSSSDAAAGSQTSQSSRLAVATSFAPPVGLQPVPSHGQGDVTMAGETLASGSLTAPAIGGTFFGGQPIRGPMSAIPQPAADARAIFPPLNTTQHGQGLALGALGQYLANTQAHTQDYSILASLHNSFQPPPDASMPFAAVSAAGGPPQSASFPLLYGTPSASSHVPGLAAMPMPMSGVPPSLPAAQTTAVPPNTGGGTAPALTPMDAASFHEWGSNPSFVFSEDTRARGISSPAAVYGAGFLRQP